MELTKAPSENLHDLHTPEPTETKNLHVAFVEAGAQVVDLTWRSTCCGREKTCSQGFVKYTVQISLSLLALVFSMYMITSEEAGQREVWISTFSTIIGLHIPNPKLEE
jgi:hypothetical protein